MPKGLQPWLQAFFLGCGNICPGKSSALHRNHHARTGRCRPCPRCALPDCGCASGWFAHHRPLRL